MKHKSLMLLLPALTGFLTAAAGDFVWQLREPYKRSVIYDAPVYVEDIDSLAEEEEADEGAVEVLDAFFEGEPMDDAEETSLLYNSAPSPLYPAYLRTVVFSGFQMLDSIPLAPTPVIGGDEWLASDIDNYELVRHARQKFIVNNPDAVRYIEWLLPEAPKKFTAEIDPESARIVIAEVAPPLPVEAFETKIERRHWLKTFNANLQFSQAFVSPNWYQGGNNNVNALAALFYNVKLNPAFHPNLLFEATFQYKLGMTNAPEDKLRSYSISEDLLQINSTVGYKPVRWKRWYYSANLGFKTQMMNSFKTNTNDMKAAFMSPSELNVGLGMTYNYVNPKKTVTFDVSLSPLSWNMKTCLNHKVNETSVGLDAGQRVKNEFGSSAELKFFWQMCGNISYRSRLFVFTDYSYAQSDWENTFMFTINRFLTTQIYVHARYDSKTPVSAENSWHKVQLKEILSFGFTYKFSSL